MRLQLLFFHLALILLRSQAVVGSTPLSQCSLDASGSNTAVSATISDTFYSSLERLARLVDIAYCVGTTGLWKPFECVSRCKDFRKLVLDSTWHTGVLLGDSCGYIAVDPGRVDLGDQIGKAGGEDDLDNEGPAIVIAFRGTYSLTNTIVDLSTIPQKYVPYPSKPDDEDLDVDSDDLSGGLHLSRKNTHEDAPRCDDCTVHMGFLESWKQARKHVLPRLRALHRQYQNHTIQLLGHSLGGAVAALAGLELATSSRWPRVVVTTFGEPRVGNDRLADFIDRIFRLDGRHDRAGTAGGSDRGPHGYYRYRRVTHVNDPVPLLPLAEWGFRSHAGELFISKPELTPHPADVVVCCGAADERCSAGQDDSGIWRQNEGKIVNVAEDKLLPQRHLPGGLMPTLPTRLQLWQLLFAHRDYFWRLGLCLPGQQQSVGAAGLENDEL